MKTKSNAIQAGTLEKQPVKPRLVLRPPLALFSDPISNAVFKQLKDQSGKDSYLKGGLVVEPGWHSNFRACYFVLLHALLQIQNNDKAAKFRHNFEKVLCSKDIKLDSFRAEQIDSMYRSFYSHDMLVTLIQDFIDMFLRGSRRKNLSQHLNQYPIIDLALILFLRAIVNSIKPPHLPPFSFSHVPSKQLAEAIFETFDTPVEFNEQTGETVFLDFGIVLREELGEVVIREIEGWKSGDCQKEKTQEIETPFKQLPLEESFNTDEDEEEQQVKKVQESPMKESCYLKLKELYESNLDFNNKVSEQSAQLPTATMPKANKIQQTQTISEKSKISTNRFQRILNQPHRIQVLSNKKRRTSPNNIDFRKSPVKDNQLNFEEPQKRNLLSELLKTQVQKDTGLTKPVLRIITDKISENATDSTPSLASPSNAQASGDKIKSIDQVLDSGNIRNKNPYNIQPNTQFAYRQAPAHSEPPPKLEIRIEYHNRGQNQPLKSHFQYDQEARHYKDLVSKPSNIRIPVGLFKPSASNSFSNQDDHHEPLKILTANRADPPKLHIQYLTPSDLQRPLLKFP